MKIFKPEVCKYTGDQVDCWIDQSTYTKFCAAGPVPYALRHEVELVGMDREEIIERVTQSQWASPIVAVRISDGSLCLSEDYKRTLKLAGLPDR